MPIIDPSSDIGRLRLRVADFGDLVLLPDSVYSQTLVDNGNNLPAAAKTCAMYILGMLSQRTHEKLAQLEHWGAEAFEGYKSFLMLTFNNPTFMDISPVPYSSNAEFSPIIDFQNNWNSLYKNGTESQFNAFSADNSPNDNSRTGLNRYGYVSV